MTNVRAARIHRMEYGQIVANITRVDVDGPQVRVSWKCAATGRVVGESTAYMTADSSMTGRVGASVKRSIASEVIYGAARALSGLLGGSIGRVVNNAVYTAANDINCKATSNVDFSEASRQAAIVAAFAGVKDQFAWDDGTRRFIARSQPTSVS